MKRDEFGVILEQRRCCPVDGTTYLLASLGVAMIAVLAFRAI